MVADAVKPNTEIVKVLEICRDIELASAELYKYFAEIFCDHEEMAALWRKTAKEEENHAMQFVLALKMRRERLVDTLAIDGSKAENVLNIVNSFSAAMRKNKPSMLVALRTAIKLEKGLVAFHMSTVACFVEESYKQLFVALMKADRNHIEALEEFYQQLAHAK